jgi:hypothetical protein
VIELAGRMETELRAAQYAHAAMIAAAERGEPSPATTNEIMIGRSLVARHAIAATELAMETAGGAAFYRDKGLERRFRDIQGARYHPMRTADRSRSFPAAWRWVSIRRGPSRALVVRMATSERQEKAIDSIS